MEAYDGQNIRTLLCDVTSEILAYPLKNRGSIKFG